MAHFAKISDTSKVLTVLTLDNKDALNADGVEEESVGQKYLEKHNNWPAEKWIQTSYNTRGGKHYDNKTGELSVDQSKALRGNYAGIGYIWDKDNNLFYSKDAPTLTAEQAVDTHYEWNESGHTWDLKTL